MFYFRILEQHHDLFEHNRREEESILLSEQCIAMEQAALCSAFRGDACWRLKVSLIRPW